MICGKIYVSVSSTKANCESGCSSLSKATSQREQTCLQIFQQVQACTTTIMCLLLLHKVCSQKGWRVLSLWANTKLALANAGFKVPIQLWVSSRAATGSPGSTARLWHCRSSPGCFWAESLILLWFSRNAFHLTGNESCYKPVCVHTLCVLCWADGAAPNQADSLEPLPHLSLGLERTKSANPYTDGEQGEEDALQSVFPPSGCLGVLIVSFLCPGASRWPTQTTCPRSLWCLYLWTRLSLSSCAPCTAWWTTPHPTCSRRSSWWMTTVTTVSFCHSASEQSAPCDM